MILQETVEGTVTSNGTLELDAKLRLSPGRVQVTVIPLPELPKSDPFFQMMQRIWADQKARGFVPRSAEEVENERRRVRDEWDERMDRIERTRNEAAEFQGSLEKTS